MTITDNSDFRKLDEFLTGIGYEKSLHKTGIHYSKRGIILGVFSEKQDLELRMQICVDFIPTRVKNHHPK